MGLQNVATHDFPKIDSDPMDEASIKHCNNVIDKVLQRAIGFPEYKALRTRSQEVQKRLHDSGVHWEPILFVTGKKPYE